MLPEMRLILCSTAIVKRYFDSCRSIRASSQSDPKVKATSPPSATHTDTPLKIIQPVPYIVNSPPRAYHNPNAVPTQRDIVRNHNPVPPPESPRNRLQRISQSPWLDMGKGRAIDADHEPRSSYTIK
ncbi:hypothetical protein FRC03_010364 [Tulasnella sp. 419]|nr:hypothetical protein FRC03_010364 [Tulasnella sp. 419]